MYISTRHYPPLPPRPPLYTIFPLYITQILILTLSQVSRSYYVLDSYTRWRRIRRKYSITLLFTLASSNVISFLFIQQIRDFATIQPFNTAQFQSRSSETWSYLNTLFRVDPKSQSLHSELDFHFVMSS